MNSRTKILLKLQCYLESLVIKYKSKKNDLIKDHEKCPKLILEQFGMLLNLF